MDNKQKNKKNTHIANGNVVLVLYARRMTKKIKEIEVIGRVLELKKSSQLKYILTPIPGQKYISAGMSTDSTTD